MPKRILWLSRHQPHRRQIERLGQIFGQIEVVQDINPFSSAEEIKRRFEEGGYDDLVVVGPLAVLARLCELGLHPLYAQMELVTLAQEADVTVQGRSYRFDRFRRLKAVELRFEEVE
jgi:hypothetical protein